MEHTREEILDALKTIQEACEERGEGKDCEACPFCRGGYCSFLDNLRPFQWEINDRDIWRAFV